MDFSLRDRSYIGLLGFGESDAGLAELARVVGKGIAEMGAVLVCGGMGGVMSAACQGAKEAGGLTIGILPGPVRSQANRFVDIAIATGMGEARNLILIRTVDVLVAIGGSYGTLSEIGFALKMGKRVIGLKTWQIEGVLKAESPEEVLNFLKTKAGG
ncbi:MAG: TIGR00725 family protein [bacterium]